MEMKMTDDVGKMMMMIQRRETLMEFLGFNHKVFSISTTLLYYKYTQFD